MARRTYIPALAALLSTICLYITRYQVQLLAAIGSSYAPQLAAVVTACGALSPILAAFMANDATYPTEADPQV